ncbi:MAG: outer membrane beta-barrel protein [Saprospiraceae bacterium]|nr:outer membrane beta-barrel protein [Candidatus Brachybacter algidus]
MKQLFISTMLMLVMQLAYGQDNTDKLSRITKIVTNDPSTVTIDSDNGEASIAYSQETAKPYRVKEGVLFIDGANEVRITTSNLSQLETNDASTAVVNGGLSNGFEVIGNDASSVAIYASLNKVVVQSNDASSISLSGTCSSLNVVANDASTVQAGDMKAEFVVAKSYDAATIIVTGITNIDTQINDESNIEILRDAISDMADSVNIVEREVEVEGGSEADIYNGDDDLNFGKDMDKWSKKKLKWRPNQRVWAGIELSMVGFSDKVFEFGTSDADNLWKIDQPSVSLHINLFEHKYKLGTDYLKFVSGLGFQWDFLRLKEDVTIINSKDKVDIVAYPNGQELKKNTLILGQIQIPLLLNINTNPGSKRNFHIDGGVVVGYRFKQQLNQEFNSSSSYKTQVETKIKSQFHQNPFDISGTVRLGIGNWSVFGMYDMASLYKKDEGPGFKVWNVGVTVIPF